MIASSRVAPRIGKPHIARSGYGCWCVTVQGRRQRDFEQIVCTGWGPGFPVRNLAWACGELRARARNFAD